MAKAKMSKEVFLPASTLYCHTQLWKMKVNGSPEYNSCCSPLILNKKRVSIEHPCHCVPKSEIPWLCMVEEPSQSNVKQQWREKEKMSRGKLGENMPHIPKLPTLNYRRLSQTPGVQPCAKSGGVVNGRVPPLFWKVNHKLIYPLVTWERKQVIHEILCLCSDK